MQRYFTGLCLGVDCLPMNVTNADWNTTAVSYETFVNVSCHQGFELSTDQYWTVVKCLANQTWSIEPLNCTRKLFPTR